MFGLELVVGGALFWLLLFVLFVCLEICTVHETHWGFLWVTAFLVIMWWGFNSNPFVYMATHIGSMLIYTGIYLALGVLWGFGKWYFFIKNAHDRIIDDETLLRTKYLGLVESKQFTGTFTDWLTERNYIPLAKNNKERISVWMLWWPFSVFATFCNDFLRRMYNYLIEKYLYIFDKINTAVFGSLNQ